MRGYIWKTRKDDYGTVEALRTYYYDEIAKDERLRIALTQITAMELLIDQIMSENEETL